MRMTRAEKKENIAGWIFITPQVIGFLAFVLFPLAFSIFLCFCEWDLITAPKFVGFDNFELVFNDTTFQKAMGNTFVYILIVMPCTLICSLSLALLTNRKLPFMKYYRAAFFLPMVTSTVAIAMVWKFIFNTQEGIINTLLMQIGIDNPPGWLTDSDFSKISISIVSIWLKVGYYYIIFDAGLKNIPTDLYEAADIDGATSFRKLFKITIPMLSPVMFFVSVMLFIDVFNMFNEAYIMTAGGPTYSTYTISMYIYNYAFYDIGRAAVASWVLFTAIAIITFIQFKIKKKVVFE